MTLIHTAELEDINPYDFLVTLLRNRDKVSEAPSSWLPWNYKDTAVDLQSANESV